MGLWKKQVVAPTDTVTSNGGKPHGTNKRLVGFVVGLILLAVVIALAVTLGGGEEDAIGNVSGTLEIVSTDEGFEFDEVVESSFKAAIAEVAQVAAAKVEIVSVEPVDTSEETLAAGRPDGLDQEFQVDFLLIEVDRSKAKSSLGDAVQSGAFQSKVRGVLGNDSLSVRGFRIRDTDQGIILTEVITCPDADSGPRQLPTKGVTIILEQSAPGTVCLLVLDSSVLLGRSYDGNNWDAMHPRLASFFGCRLGKRCRVALPSIRTGTITLRSMRPASDIESAQVLASRFLSQATFGPTRGAIDAFNGNRKAWIENQLSLPATLHREFYRKRANQRLQFQVTTGRPFRPCEALSRWHRFAFTNEDVGKIVNITNHTTHFSWSIDGILRHQTYDPIGLNLTDPSAFIICDVIESVHGTIAGGNVTTSFCLEELMNPALDFIDTPPLERMASTLSVSLIDLSPPVQDAKLLGEAIGTCNEHLQNDGAVFVQDTNGTYHMFDPRLVMLDNIVEAPAYNTSGTTLCPNVPMNFVNMESCMVSTTACIPEQYSDTRLELNETSLRTIYLKTGRYVYSINGLTAADEDSPCETTYSRWKIIQQGSSCGGDAMNGQLDQETEATLVGLLANSTDANPLIRDIFRPKDVICTATATSFAGMKLDVLSKDGLTTSCFQHVHPELHNVYDFSYWVLPNTHPGNSEAQKGNRPNPIQKFADTLKLTELTFPSYHPMSRWDKENHRFTLLGRLYDTIDFQSLPPELQTDATARAFGASSRMHNNDDAAAGDLDAISVSCGSPGEVSPDPTLGARFAIPVSSSDDVDLMEGRFDEIARANHFKTITWTMIALQGSDQLRQRLAWALSQILVVSSDLIDNDKSSELFVTYYDIFVRNAFGSYRDILREVSYSPAMGEMLTYIRSRSLGYNMEYYSVETFPDENFAREIMQLFTIGIWELHMDGTRVLGKDGKPIPTYDNEDILEFARAWTGFDRQPFRGNINSQYGSTSSNKIDPMIVKGEWRDVFPKMDLHEGFIGDQYPLCKDLPRRAFLRKGAIFRLLGTSPLPKLQRDPSDFGKGSNVLRMRLNPHNSTLFHYLCNDDASNSNQQQQVEGLAHCNFVPQIVLEDNLPCEGLECSVDTVRVVMLPNSSIPRCPTGWIFEPDGAENSDVCREPVSNEWSCPVGCELNQTTNSSCTLLDSLELCKLSPVEEAGIFFEYIRPPCVEHPFYDNALVISRSDGKYAMCADPELPVASEACCSESSVWAKQYCDYHGERLTYATARRRCKQRYDDRPHDTCNFRSCRRNCQVAWRTSYHWTSLSCTVQAKIRLNNGKVAIVHDPPQSARDDIDTKEYMRKIVNKDTNSWFQVPWHNQRRPENEAECNATPGCEVLSQGQQCLCNVSITETPVFLTAPATRQEALAKLKIGAWSPDMFPPTAYTLDEENSTPLIKVFHFHNGTQFDKNTLFQVQTNEGKTKTFKNVLTQVHIGGNKYSFRNPPTFLTISEPETRDAEYETEAVLDHLFTHPNVPPFMALRLIQRFVTSNPTPRYIKSVATAFRKGQYETIGSGKYGDLGATIAAVLLDPEATSAVLDADPYFGLLKEPILKVIHFMKSLEIKPRDTFLELYSVHDDIGMMAYHAPSVFSFVQYDYAPKGPITKAGMVAPEAELLTAPWIVGTVNGLASLAQLGLMHCAEGFGRVYDMPTSCWRAENRDEHELYNRGTLTYAPDTLWNSSQIVEDLSILLTNGRLDPSAKSFLEEQINKFDDIRSPKAIRLLHQLFSVLPEFHSSNENQRKIDEDNADVQPSRNGTEPFKAVVYVFLSGGMDSYNALVPHSQCRDKDLYQEYVDVRGFDLAIPQNDLLQIQVPTGTQPCDVFGLHPALKTVQTLYQENDATFFANTGVLVEPITKKAGERPPALYAHNTQTQYTQTVHPQSLDAGGVMGRMVDALYEQGYNPKTFSIAGSSLFLEPEEPHSPEQQIVHRTRGVESFETEDQRLKIENENGTIYLDVMPLVEFLNNQTVSSVFGKTWAKKLMNTVTQSRTFASILESIQLEQTFAAGDTYFGSQMEQTARLIKAKQAFGMDRAAFYLTFGSFDTHSDNQVTLQEKLTDIDNAVKSFVEEMKLQNLWNDVTIVFASEFGRTLTSNGEGTDHAWGGNYWMLGGGVKGGKILGQYPDDLTDESPQNLGRGRMIPTTSWDAVWNGVAQWLGIQSQHLDTILPNRNNFPAEQIFQGHDLFN